MNENKKKAKISKIIEFLAYSIIKARSFLEFN